MSHTIFCGHCGTSRSGQVDNGYRYYRRANRKTMKNRECHDGRNSIPANEIEELVLLHLFGTFGNVEAVRKASEAAVPNLDKAKEYQDRLRRIQKELSKIEQGRNRLMDCVVEGTLT